LFGIDAPELAQPCDDGRWHPGPIATRELAALIARRHVECTSETRDRYGRTVATCTADGDDIGAAMVARGWAWAFTKYSRRYLELQQQAAADRLGVHAHRCELPADYRAARSAVPASLK
jgi:endonuclease YncB( thermonuclease family)